MQNDTFIIFGFLLIFIGISIILLSYIGTKNIKVHYGVGGFIGPIPFGFANSKEMLYIVILLTIIIVLMYIFGGKLW